MADARLAYEFAAAFNRRDMAAMRRLVTDDLEVIPLRAAIEDVAYHGKDGLARWVRDVDEIWTDLEILVDAVEDPAPDKQLVRARLVGRGHESDAPVETAVLFNVDFVGDRARRIATVLDR